LNSSAKQIAANLNVAEWQVNNAIDLIKEGATIPFIARYRKEFTGELTDIQLIEIQKQWDRILVLDERKKAVLKSLDEHGFINDDLRNKIGLAQTIAEVEDIYLPYKPKRKTRAVIARDRGLEPLAKMIMSENVNNVDEAARRFISDKLGVSDSDDALAGARDIIAEWISEYQWVRQKLRLQFEKFSSISSVCVKGKEEDGANYSSWFDWSENAGKAPSHRILAMFRGEKEDFLKLKIEPDKDNAIEQLSSRLIKNSNPASEQKKTCNHRFCKTFNIPIP